MKRACPELYPGVIERALPGPERVRKHVLTCTCEGCKGEMAVTISGKRKPPSAIYNMAKRRGWKVDLNHNRFVCPAHEGASA